MSGIEVIKCEIAPKALYFPSKLPKIIISEAYNSALKLSILTYAAILESIKLFRLSMLSNNCNNTMIYIPRHCGYICSFVHFS